jgi:hypothetical protein
MLIESRENAWWLSCISYAFWIVKKCLVAIKSFLCSLNCEKMISGRQKFPTPIELQENVWWPLNISCAPWIMKKHLVITRHFLCSFWAESKENTYLTKWSSKYFLVVAKHFFIQRFARTLLTWFCTSMWVLAYFLLQPSSPKIH